MKIKFLLLTLTFCLTFILSAKLIYAQTCQTNDRNQGLISALGLSGSTFFGNFEQVCVVDTQASYREFKVPSFDDLKNQYYDLSRSTVKKGINQLSGTNLNFAGANAGNGIYYQSGSMTLTSAAGTGTQVIFVEGDLNIAGNITYGDNDSNSGLVFIVKGNINIYSSVTQVNAVLISSGIICTAYNNTAGACMDGGTFTPGLTINGSLISLNKEDLPAGTSAILFRRSLSLNDVAAEVTNKQPKYLYNLRNGLFTKDLIIIEEDKHFNINAVPSAFPFPSIGSPQPAPSNNCTQVGNPFQLGIGIFKIPDCLRI